MITAILLSSDGSSAAPVKQVRRVLIFYELGLSSPAITLLDREILSALENSPFQIELYREYLETTLFPGPTEQQELREGYLHKYRGRKPDLIIALGPSPLRFISDVHERAFKNVPVVFGGTTVELADYPNLNSCFTGVWEKVEPEKTLEAALQLQSGTRHVVVVGGTSSYDRHVEAIFRDRLRDYEKKLDIEYLTDLDMPTLLDWVAHLPQKTIILYANFEQDAAGTRFIAASQADPMIAAAANAPIFTPSDVDWGHGEVGGDVLSFSTEGKTVGQTALAILEGRKPQDIPVVHGSNVYMFDWRALRRWRFSESNLPPGSIVLNRQLNVWDSYKWYIVGGIFLLLAQASLIVGLLVQRLTRRKAEAALKESEERFRLVANTAPVMIWMSEADKKCNYFNKPWLHFTGRSLEQELGNGWADCVHSEDLGECLKTYTEAFDKREQFEMQYRLRRHDGEYRWVYDIGVPRFNEAGTFAGFIGSCIDVTERKRAEEALSTIGRRLIEAHEEERTRIGRELHDDIGQRLALLAIELGQLSQEQSEANFQQLLRHPLERIMEISKDLQTLSHHLHSSKLEYMGLTAAARSFCKEVSQKAKVEVQFSHSEVSSPMPKEVSLSLFRVLQEALQNAIKHSGVRLFHVNLRGTSSGVELTISDDGKGFDEHEGFSGQGLGLISMRERIQMLHGTLEVKTRPGAGTTISARVPLQVADLRAKAG